MADEDVALMGGWIAGAIVGFIGGMIWTSDLMVGLGLTLFGAFAGAAVAYGIWKMGQ